MAGQCSDMLRRPDRRQIYMKSAGCAGKSTACCEPCSNCLANDGMGSNGTFDTGFGNQVMLQSSGQQGAYYCTQLAAS